MMKVTAIIVAGGKGLRMKMDLRKQYLEVAGLPILARTLKAFHECLLISDICLVVPEEDIPFCEKSILGPLAFSKPVNIVAGGEERQKSVYNGLKSLCRKDDALVAIHDGVRPFVTSEKIVECVEAAKVFGAAILAVPMTDTLKVAGKDGMIEKSLDRSLIWAAQTPQVFRYGLIWEAHQWALRNHVAVTDDASIVEKFGKKVRIVQGSRNNFKITTKEDLLLAGNYINEIEGNV
jgi:2-C-methyl-D-erythritol 4-phosphate cytidylyltransferase